MNHLRDTELLKTFGEGVKKLRQERGFTQKQLALKMDVEISQVSRIERGLNNPTLTTLIHLAESLEVNVCQLFGKKLGK